MSHAELVLFRRPEGRASASALRYLRLTEKASSEEVGNSPVCTGASVLDIQLANEHGNIVKSIFDPACDVWVCRKLLQLRQNNVEVKLTMNPRDMSEARGS